MSISKERIERAAKAIAANINNAPDTWRAWTEEARDVLAGDAPALLAAKIEGLREGGEIALGMLRNGRTLSSEIAAELDKRLTAIDAATPAPDERRSVAEIRARIAELRPERERSPTAVSNFISALEWVLATETPALKEQ